MASRADATPRLGPLTPGQPFGTRYKIIKLLGLGGMGAVYQAWDADLGVAVALKVIRPEATADPAAAQELERRFKQELLLAREVTHKNVVRIHDLGEIDGIKYITMPYVQGADLATVLREKGKLSVPEVLKLARQIAAGLQAAHEVGVVHRDLKPANIMIAGDHALIMDFGIARSTSRGGSPAGGAPGQIPLDSESTIAAQTVIGAVIGTLEYMAPEQAKGQPADQRADIYAFGLIFYDMLLGGRKASSGGTAFEDLQRRIDHAPPSARSIQGDIPEAVDAIVSRCVQPDPAARYQTTGELVAALDRLDAEGNLLPEVRPLTRRMLLGAAVGLVALLAGTWWIARPRPVPAQPPPTSVLIADFANRPNDPVFEGTLEQALTIALEGAPFITTFPRTTAQRVAAQIKAGSRLDQRAAQLVALREGIKIILAGAIESGSDEYAIAVNAIDPANGNVLHTARASAQGKGKVLEAVGAIAADLRTALGDTTPEADKAAAAETFTSASLEAVQAYARGQDLSKTGKPREALKAFEQAIALDPDFGRAYANMAAIYSNLKQEDKAKEVYERALKYVDRITDREKYRILGIYYLGLVRNYELAIKNYETLVNLYPADNQGYSNLALAYLYVRNVQRAREVSRKALEIYPRNLLQRTNYATYSMYAGDFRVAVEEAKRVLQENPSYEFARLTLALSTLAQGDVEGGRAEYARLASVSPLGASLARMGEADLEMAFGRYPSAVRILQAGIAADRREESATNMAIKQVALAEAYLALGRRAQAARAASDSIGSSTHESVLFPAARVLVAAGQPKKAAEIATTLENMLQTQTRSYGRLIKGMVALHEKRYADAIEAFREGQKLHDSWWAHLLVATVYTEADRFGEALADWELCVKRRGEATDVFFADTSSLRYLPPVYYWLGRSHEALGATSGARADYQEFLKWRGDAAPPDPLAADARRRLGQ